MATLGLLLKRKSVEKIDPVLPTQRKPRERSPEGRTKHKDEKPPAEQLKQFRQKQLITLSTEKSISQLNSSDLQIMRQSRFDDDHHNTESIALLLSSKMNSNLPTVRSKLSGTVRTFMPEERSKKNNQEGFGKERERLEKEKEGLDREKESLDGKEKESNGSNNENQQEREGSNYDDYVLGQKIDDEEESIDNKAIAKKYAYDSSSKSLTGYIPKSESELRLQKVYVNNERKKLMSMKEDRQIQQIMQQYQNRRQAVLNQSKRKHQMAGIMASLARPCIQTMQPHKSESLPALKPKREVVLPEVEESGLEKIRSNVLGKGFSREEINPLVANRLKKSLSFGKLGFGRKRVRTICQQEIYEKEMVSVEQIRCKLRSKGISVDADKLIRGLTNNKQMDTVGRPGGYPESQLPSNPIYQKFPL